MCSALQKRFSWRVLVTEFVLNPEINSYAVVQVGGYQLVKYEYEVVLNDNYASSMNSVDVQYDTGVECRGILVPLKGRGKKNLLAWLNTTGPTYIRSKLGA